MKRTLALLVLCLVTGTAHARRDSGMNRGGLGFLFPDHNLYLNPGQVASNRGIGLEGLYTRSTDSAGIQQAIPSIAFGTGQFGVGVYGFRTGTNLTNSAAYTDVVAAAMGFALLKERLTIGMGYASPLNGGDGALTGTVNFNGPKGKGFSIGAGYTTTTGSTRVQSAVGGLGYRFGQNNSFEGNITFNDLDEWDDFTAGGFVNLGNKWVYVGAGYEYLNLSSSSRLRGRLGFILGGSVDVSGLIKYVVNVSDFEYGASIRFAF